MNLLAQGQPSNQDDSSRIGALERDVALIKYSLEIVRDVAIALGGVATVGLVVFGYLSYRRESTAQENFRRERRFYESGQRWERLTYARERKFYEQFAHGRAEQESRQNKQQWDMGSLLLNKFDEMLANQARNIKAIGDILGVIGQASEIRLQREQGEEKFTRMLKSLRDGAERRYSHTKQEAERLSEVKAAQWPELAADRRQIASGALRAYEHVDDFLKEEKEKAEDKKDVLSHAALLQRLGVFAYYVDFDYEGAIDYLSTAIRLFGNEPVEDQFKPPQAWARHFLGVLKKNWPLRLEASGTSLRQAQELFASAEDYLTIKSGQFLTPLTNAEILSYSLERHNEAIAKLTEIIASIEALGNKADRIQLGLLPRAYLLRGNIEHMRGDLPAACEWFTKAAATDIGARSPYTWLSLAEATGAIEEARPHWEKGLVLLPRPPANDKPETSTRLLIFTWGILASHFLGDIEMLKRYRTAFDDLGATIERSGKYMPLFFSPTSKKLLSFDELSQELNGLGAVKQEPKVARTA